MERVTMRFSTTARGGGLRRILIRIVSGMLGGEEKGLRECQAVWTKRHCEMRYCGKAKYKNRWQGDIDEKRIKTVEAVYLMNGICPRPNLRSTFKGDPLLVNQVLADVLGGPTAAID